MLNIVSSRPINLFLNNLPRLLGMLNIVSSRLSNSSKIRNLGLLGMLNIVSSRRGFGVLVEKDVC